MAIALVAHTSANSAAGVGSTATTAGIDTTGATLLIANVTYFNAATTPQVTDSNNNTWIPLPIQFQTDAATRFLYCSNPVVGAGHTFTYTNGSFSSMQIAAFSGVTQLAPLDVSSGSKGTSSSATGGSVTPSNTNSLVISACGARNTGNISSVGGGFTITDNVSTGSVIDGAIAYLIQTSIVAANPAWTLSGSINWGVTNTVFIAGTATVPTTPAIVASVNKQSTSGTHTVTSVAIDTTGATLLVLSQSAFSAGLGTVTDSAGNVWTSLTAQSTTNITQQLFYCLNPITSATHTFTVTNLGSGSFQVAAISGTSTFDVSAGGSGVGDNTLGSVTPSTNGSIIIAAMALENGSGAGLVGIDKDFKLIKIEPATGPPTIVTAGAIAFISQVTATALNPKWYFSTSAGHMAGTNAVFKPTSGTLTVTGSDTLVLSDSLALVTPILGSTFNDTLSLSDALAQNIGFALKNSDTLSLSDAIASTLGMIISDSFTLSDLLRYGLSLPVVISGDSLNLSDAIVFLIGVGLGKSDTLSFSDVLKLGASVSRSLGDNILLSDFLAALITQLPSYSDTFGLSDSARLTLSLGLSQNDSLALLDAVKIAIVNNLILNQTDSLSLSDSVQFDLSSNLDQYIRHYLNDVLR